MATDNTAEVIISASLDKASFDNAALRARDTLKPLDKSVVTKLELNIVDFQQKLAEARKDLKSINKSGGDNTTQLLLKNDLTRNLTEAKGQLSNYLNTGETGVSRLQAKFGALGTAVSDVGSRIKSYGQFLLASSIIGGVGSFVKSVFDLTSQNQLLEKSFTALLGSGEKAGQMLQTITDIALKTPFNRLEIADAAKKMLAFGFSAEQAVIQIRVLSDATAALGGTQDDFNGISRAFGQIASKNRLFQEELNQLTERGIPAVTILKDKLKLTEDQLKNIGKVGIDANTAIGTLLEGLNEKFAGSAERATTTLSGRLSNVKDMFQKIVIDFGNSINPILESLVGSIENFVKNKLPGILQGTAVFLNNLKEGFTPLLPLFETVATRIGYAAQNIANLAQSSTKVVQFFGTAGIALATFGSSLVSLLGLVVTVSGPVGWLIASITALGIAFLSTQTNIFGFNELIKLTTPEMNKLQGEIDINLSKQKELTEEFKKGTISIDEYARRIKGLQQEQGFLSEKFDNAKQNITNWTNGILGNKSEIEKLSKSYEDNIGMVVRLKNGSLTFLDTLELATKGLGNGADAVSYYTDEADRNLISIKELEMQNLKLNDSLIKAQAITDGNTIKYAILNGEIIDLTSNTLLAQAAQEQLNSLNLNFDNQVKEVQRLSLEFGYLSDAALTAMNRLNQGTQKSIEKIGNPLAGLGNPFANNKIDFKYTTSESGAKEVAAKQQADIRKKEIEDLFKRTAPTGGGAKGKKGKTDEQKAKDEYDAQKKLLDAELELEIAQANKLGRSAEEKEKLIARIKEEYVGKDLQLKKKILGETLGLTEYEVKKQKEYADEVATYNNNIYETGKTKIEKIGDTLEKSSKKMEEYGKKVKEAEEKFKDLQKEATKDLSDINTQLSELDKSQGEELGANLIELKKSLPNLEKELRDLQGKGPLETDDLTRMNEVLKEIADTKREIEVITSNTTEQQRTEAANYDKLNSSEKLLKKNQEERAILNEKALVDNAILKANLDTKITNLRTDESGRAFVIDPETNKETEITDAKNKQYVIDSENKIREQNIQFSEYTNKLAAETRVYKDNFILKIQAEEDFTKALGVTIKQREKDLESYATKMKEVGTTIKDLVATLQGTGVDLSTVAGLTNVSGLPTGTTNNSSQLQTFNFTFNGQTVDLKSASALNAANQYVQGGGRNIEDLKRVIQLSQKGSK